MKMNDVKSDVKKLLQEHIKTNTNAVSTEIESPYAKFNSRGQLMCIVCGVPVKSKIIWQAHVNKRSHKENLTRLKETQDKISKLQYQKLEQEKNKRRQLSSDTPSVNPNKISKLEKPKGILKNVGTAYSSSEEESDQESGVRLSSDVSQLEVKQENSSNPNLPDNFFDDSTPNVFTTEPHKLDVSKKDAKNKASTSDALPEGFFDDPVADAKARNVEYRDKDAEEWESFMKAVSVAEVESRQIIAEDKEEAAFATQLEQTNEQIKCLERIVELDKAKQSQLSEKKVTTSLTGEDESSDEEFSPVIWRTKNSLI